MKKTLKIFNSIMFIIILCALSCSNPKKEYASKVNDCAQFQIHSLNYQISNKEMLDAIWENCKANYQYILRGSKYNH